MRDYRHLFEQLNPLNVNGCPVRGTFFVSHEWTNYNDVEWLASQGHEMASNSIRFLKLIFQVFLSSAKHQKLVV